MGRRRKRNGQEWMLAEIMSEVTEAPVIVQPAKSEDKLEIEKEEAGETTEKVEVVSEKPVESAEKAAESDEKVAEAEGDEKAEEKPVEGAESSEVIEEKKRMRRWKVPVRSKRTLRRWGRRKSSVY